MPSTPRGTYVCHYEESGAGLPVVLLHGYPLDSRIWLAQREALSDRFRVITPDLRGFGKSTSSDPFTIEALVDDVHELLVALGAQRCVLGGLSMGGYVALAYVRKYLSELRGMMLIDTRAEADTPQGKEGRMNAIELVRAKGPVGIADQMLPKMLAPGAASARPLLARQLRDIMEACPAITIEHALRAMNDRPDRTAELGSISLPALVLVGDADAITPPATAETMSRGIPGSRLVVIRGAGHMTPMEQPQQVNRALRAFLMEITRET